MLSALLPVVLALASGVSVVIQQVLNANLRGVLQSGAWSGFMSYALGVICMVALALLLQDPLPSVATASQASSGIMCDTNDAGTPSSRRKSGTIRSRSRERSTAIP